MSSRFMGLLLAGFLLLSFSAVAQAACGSCGASCGNCSVYSCYCGTRPAWLDQNLVSTNGNYSIWYTDRTHYNAPFIGGADSDLDTLPDAWESNFWGNLSFTQFSDPDADGDNNGVELAAGSWPHTVLYRRWDPIDPGLNGAGRNIVVQDLIDTFMFCQGRYAAWGFNAPWGLPLTVFVRYTGFGGWGSVNPIWISSDNYANILADPDRTSVTVHELFHNVQKAYPDVPRDTHWFIEGSARMSEDCFFLDVDRLPQSLYCGEVRGFLSNPEEAPLFERSYNAVFFWKYLLEQTGGTITGQPSGKFDAMHAFMRASRGMETSEAVKKHLADLPDGHRWKGASFDRFFGTWITALYARQFNAASLDPIYYYKDEQENLPSSRERPVNISNCAYNAAANAYTPQALPGGGSVNFGDTNAATWALKLPAWRSRYYAFRPSPGTRFIIAEADGKTGQRNYYALVTSRTGSVRNVVFNYGEDLLRAFYNEPLDELGVVIGSLSSSADYNLTLWMVQEFGLQIRDPLSSERGLVRIFEDGSLSPLSVRVRVAANKTSGGSSVVAGLPKELFQVAVNGQSSTVVNAYMLGEEYHLSCLAPTLSAGNYDLRVRLLDQTDTETNSVEYRASPHVDRMIVVDRSGSMGSELMGNNEKLLAAKMGAMFYTDLMAEDDMVGLASFGTSGRLDENLETMDGLGDAHREAMKDAIQAKIPNDVPGSEHTAMGQGITNAFAELLRRGDTNDEWRMTLLTDGIEDVAPFWGAASVSGVVVGSRVKIDAVAIGNGAHEYLLQDIAWQTGGEYYYIPVPRTIAASKSRAPRAPAPGGVDPEIETEAANVYRLINEKEQGLNRIWSEQGAIYYGAQNVSIPFTVYEGMKNLKLTVNWPAGNKLDLALRSPSGDDVPPNLKDSTHAIFDLKVEPGEWTLELRSTTQTPYLAVLTGQGNLRAQVYATHPEGTTAGSVQRLHCALTSKSHPVLGSSVFADITTPSGQVTRLQLFDDADHGDPIAGDGIYSREYRRTPWPGTYRVKAVAEGEDGGDRYRIEQNACFLIESFNKEQDPDYDGMPTVWEIRYGLNPYVNDADKDLDEDGVRNYDEYTAGGNPASTDTDLGGTPDGAEWNLERSIVDFTDDLSAPPNAFFANLQPTDAYDPDFYGPESGELALYWSKNTNYQSVDIYRSLSAAGPFTLIVNDTPAAKRPYVDGGLVNGTKYYYKITATTAEGVLSRMSEVLEATPKADSIAPWGEVDIVSSNGTVKDVNVTLNLWASSDATQMRLSNTARFEGILWEAFAATRAWRLAGANGANFVYAQFRDAAGNVSVNACAGVMYVEQLGWTLSPWFGWYYNFGGGWIWHLYHGAMYRYSLPDETAFLWAPDMQWLWTGSPVYPFFYRFSDACWIWYLQGSASPRWFYEFCSGLWKSY